MAAKKAAAKTTTTTRRRPSTTKKKVSRRKKKPDFIEDLLAVGAGYIGSDLLPVIPLVGPSLAKLNVPPQIPTAGLAFIGGKMAGGTWKRAGKLAALGAALNLLVIKAKESEKEKEPGTKGLGAAADQRLLSARELFEELDREQVGDVRIIEAPQSQPRVRLLGEILS